MAHSFLKCNGCWGIADFQQQAYISLQVRMIFEQQSDVQAFKYSLGVAMETITEIIKAELPNGAIIHIQATALGSEEEVAFTLPSFKEVTDAVEGIAESFVTTLRKVKP